MPSGFGPREPEPSICALPSLPVTSTTGSRSAPSRETNSPFDDPQVVGRDLEHVAGELEQLAAQVVGRGAHGGHHRRHRLRAARDRARRRRSASPPTSTRTRSSGRPSSSAATIANAVVTPVPMSWMPVTTVTTPSRPRRTSACAGGPPPPHQIWQAHAHAAQQAVGVLAVAQRVALGPARQLGGAVVAGREVLGASTAGRCPGRRRRGCARRSSSGSMRERGGELVDRLLEAERALHHAGRAERVRTARRRSSAGTPARARSAQR